MFSKFDNNLSKIEQNLVLPTDFYAIINTQTDLENGIAQKVKPFYDDNDFDVYVCTSVLKSGNNDSQYNKYRLNKFGHSGSSLADFDYRKILAPVKYKIEIKVSSKKIWWLSKKIEQIIEITEKI